MLVDLCHRFCIVLMSAYFLERMSLDSIFDSKSHHIDLMFPFIKLVHCSMALTLVCAYAEIVDKAGHKAFSMVRKISLI